MDTSMVPVHLSVGVAPRQMTEVGINRTAHHLCFQCFKFIDAIAKRNDLRWTHECEIQWVKEEHQIFAFVIRQLNFLEIIVDDGGSFEIWCRLLNVSNGQPGARMKEVAG